MSGCGDVEWFGRRLLGQVQGGVSVAEVNSVEEGLVGGHPVIEGAAVELLPGLLGRGIGRRSGRRSVHDAVRVLRYGLFALAAASAEECQSCATGDD